MKLVFLHGAPGVGKLTIARELAKLTGYPVFHNHLTLDMLSPVFGFGTPAFIELREEFWLKVFRRASQEGVPGLIFTFVFEPTVQPGFVARVQDAIGKGGVLRPFELRCDAAEHEMRVVQPDRAAYGKLMSVGDLRGWLAAGDYEPPSHIPNNVVIDTTHLSAAEAARVIAERLEQE